MDKFKEIIRQYPFLGFIIAFIILMLVPSVFFTDLYQSHLASLICINIIVAAGLNIVKGFCGQVTVGHVGIYAVGSYTAGCMFLYLGSGLWLTLPAAILIAGLFGVAFAIPSFRLEGPYLALATLGGGEAIRLFIENGDFFMSTYGISNIPQPIIFGVPFDTPDKYYYIAMPIMLIAIYFSFSVLRSSVGRAFMAVREDPISAAASGINVKKHKMYKKRLNKIHRWVKKEGDWLHKNLSKFSSLKPLPSNTNFQLIKSQYSILNILENLKKRGILLRDCRSFINLGEDWFRISLQKRKDNIQIINTLKEYIN